MIAAIVGPFAEAVRATAQPCTFLLIVPVSCAVIAARATWQSLVWATGAAVIGGWMLAANEFVLDGAVLRLSAVMVIAALALLIVPSNRLPSLIRVTADAQLRAAVVAFVTLVATQWWRPCVGEELGVVLTGAQRDLIGQLVPMAAYMLGAMAPVALVVAIRYAVDLPERAVAATGWVATTIGIVVALSLVGGRHDDVVVTLTRWTLG